MVQHCLVIRQFILVRDEDSQPRREFFQLLLQDTQPVIVGLQYLIGALSAIHLSIEELYPCVIDRFLPFFVRLDDLLVILPDHRDDRSDCHGHCPQRDRQRAEAHFERSLECETCLPGSCAF